MILFIHGFASCGLGAKSRVLIRHYGRDRVLTPDLPHEPDAALALLRSQCEAHPVELLIGSSLGGFYATCLNADNHVPAVLVNPVVRAADLFAQNLGQHTRWCDGRLFEIGAQHVAQLRRLERPRLRPDERYLVLLNSGDEVLDYRLAADYYQAFDVVVEPGGDHRFDNLRDHLPRIDAFAGNRRDT